jgi:hypothetical protein
MVTTTARTRDLSAPVAWLMIFLLLVPGSLAVTSLGRALANQSEESTPVSQSEEKSEQGRTESHAWHLVNRHSGPAHFALAPQAGHVRLSAAPYRAGFDTRENAVSLIVMRC